MAAADTARLLEAEPDIGRFLTAAECAAAQQISVPVRTVTKGALDLSAVLAEARGFGALVLEGMLLQRLRVGDQVALRLLGPGDILGLTDGSHSMLLADLGYRSAGRTRLAVLGNEVLLAAHRWPRIVAGLHVRVNGQSDRLATQMAICQLPRVDQRLIALMWLLAETWGQVTAIGTTLPLALTHDALGGLIGARRPTVTLALRELTDRGAVVRQDRGWLLLEPPPQPTGPMPKIDGPELLNEVSSNWAAGTAHGEATAEPYAGLTESVAMMLNEHARNVQSAQERLALMASERERCRQVRTRIASQALSRRRAPS